MPLNMTNPHDDEIFAIAHIGKDILIQVVIRYHYQRDEYLILIDDKPEQEIDADRSAETARRIADAYLNGYVEGYNDGATDEVAKVPRDPPDARLHVHTVRRGDVHLDDVQQYIHDLRN